MSLSSVTVFSSKEIYPEKKRPSLYCVHVYNQHSEPRPDVKYVPLRNVAD